MLCPALVGYNFFALTVSTMSETIDGIEYPEILIQVPLPPKQFPAGAELERVIQRLVMFGWGVDRDYVAEHPESKKVVYRGPMAFVSVVCKEQTEFAMDNVLFAMQEEFSIAVSHQEVSQ